jgi:hypothetical protein
MKKFTILLLSLYLWPLLLKPSMNKRAAGPVKNKRQQVKWQR